MTAAPAKWSLRKRLLAVGAATGVLAWLVGGAVIYHVVQLQDAMLFDARLKDIAQTLLVFADHEISEIEAQGLATPPHIETDGTSHGRYRYQVWSKDNRLLLSSINAPSQEPLMPLAEAGWATREVNGERLRVVTLDGPSLRYRIQAAEPLAQRLDAGDLLSPALAPGLVLSALVLGLLLALLHLALQPLRNAAGQLAQRGPNDLRPVAAEDMPSELEPLIGALNRLLQRLDVALRSEREFVSAAAHELRTPLAGLRAQAQLAAHERIPAEQRREALVAVQEGVDHAAHLVGQLLDLARSDVLAGDPLRLGADRATIDVRALFEQLLAELGPAAAERGVRFGERFEVPVLSGSAFGIALILRNLLANAVAYTAPDSEVLLGTRAEDGHTVLWVADRGPGIAAEERERIFDRFYRVRGTAAPGCGLGLSIVKALADAHGARVRLADAAGGGLLAEVVFPA